MTAIGIAVATVAAFVVSFVFYAVVPAGPVEPAAPDTAAPAGRPAPWRIAVELCRGAVTAALVAGLLLAAGWSGAAAGSLLGLALWALPLVLLAGSVTWEGVPVRRAAPHAGDWLIKLVVVGAVVGAFG